MLQGLVVVKYNFIRFDLPIFKVHQPIPYLGFIHFPISDPGSIFPPIPYLGSMHFSHIHRPIPNLGLILPPMFINPLHTLNLPISPRLVKPFRILDVVTGTARDPSSDSLSARLAALQSSGELEKCGFRCLYRSYTPSLFCAEADDCQEFNSKILSLRTTACCCCSINWAEGGGGGGMA